MNLGICDKCTNQATQSFRETKDVTPPGSEWAEFEVVGGVQRRCDDHRELTE